MIAMARPVLVPPRAYITALAALMVAGFIGGGVANFVYARKHPAADVYNPVVANVIKAPTIEPERTQIATTVAPTTVVQAPALWESVLPGYGRLDNPINPGLQITNAGGQDPIDAWIKAHPNGEVYMIHGQLFQCMPEHDQDGDAVGRTCRSR